MQLPLLKPMLAVTASKPFNSPEYYFEVKWDGYRCLAYLENGCTKLLSRNNHELTGAFPDLAEMHKLVDGLPLLLDGEIVVMSGGKPSFDALQSRAGLSSKLEIDMAVKRLPAVFIAFDILYYQGASLINLSLERRRETLDKVVRNPGKIVVSEVIAGDGVKLYFACVEQGLEGIIAKKITGNYQPGYRSSLWKKIRHIKEADLVICGYRQGNGNRILGALALGAWNGQHFVYQGMVGTGLTRVEEKRLIDSLKPIETASSAIKTADPKFKNIIWVKPLLVCIVEYLTLTREGYLRHPVYKGIRNDKEPQECLPLKKI